MDALDCLRFAALIILVLPIVVMPWEGRRPPSVIYVTLATTGAAFAFARSGLTGSLQNLAAGMVCLVSILTILTIVRIRIGFQILTGGQIKLLSSCAIWLGLVGSLAMIIVTGIAVFIIAAVNKMNGISKRPDFGAVAVGSILCIGFGQLMFLA